MCREPGDENVLSCDRWNLDTPICNDTFNRCPHRWEFSSCPSIHNIKLCKMKSNMISAMDKSVFETCRYGFTTSFPPSKSTLSFTTVPMKTPETSHTTESEKSKDETLSATPMTTSGTSHTTESEKSKEETLSAIPMEVWIFLCCSVVFITVIILALFI